MANRPPHTADTDDEPRPSDRWHKRFGTEVISGDVAPHYDEPHEAGCYSLPYPEGRGGACSCKLSRIGTPDRS